MTPDPKPPVTHGDARMAVTRMSEDNTDTVPWHDLETARRYIDQQEAAERERNLEREGASFVNDGLRAKLQAAEHFVEQHRAGCPRHAAIYAAERERDSMRMQRDVFQEKLNEYIDKTKEAEKDARNNFVSYERIKAKYSEEVTARQAAEKRAEEAEGENAELKALLSRGIDYAQDPSGSAQDGSGFPEWCDEACAALRGYDLFVCQVCGAEDVGEMHPDRCGICGHAREPVKQPDEAIPGLIESPRRPSEHEEYEP